MRQRPPCYNKALDLLSRRAHFRRELMGKLLRRGYDEEEVTDAVERLVAKGFLDEQATIRDFLAARLARGPLGRRRLLADLGRRGVESDVAQSAVDQVCNGDELEPARQATERWRARRPRGEPAALARHLERRGFSRRAIFSILRELPPGDETSGQAANFEDD